MSSASMTAAEAAASHRAHAAYCRDKAQKRAAEGRHDIARQWRLEAQEAEAKARELEHSAPVDAAPVFQAAVTPGAQLEQAEAA